jgi:hypothetical protein
VRDDIEMDRKQIEWSGMDRIHVTQDKEKWRVLVNMAMNEGYYLMGYNTV